MLNLDQYLKMLPYLCRIKLYIRNYNKVKKGRIEMKKISHKNKLLRLSVIADSPHTSFFIVYGEKSR